MFQKFWTWWYHWGLRSRILIGITAVLIPLFIAAVVVIFTKFGGPLNILFAK
jgi:hypothetical protein